MIKYGMQLMDGRPEKYLRVRMPWKRQLYRFSDDAVIKAHPTWLAIWSMPPCPGGFKFRCGWTVTE